MELAPVYDCGSSLYPQADDTIMEAVLSDEQELHFRVFEIPTSAIMLEGKKNKYYDFISSLCDNGCNRALERIVPRIDMVRIKEIVEDTPFISELQKKFYLTMHQERKSRILNYALEQLRGIAKG